MVYLRIIFVIVIINFSYAQEVERDNLYKRFIADAHLTVNGSVHVISTPYHWNSSDWASFGAITGATLLSYFLDRNIRNVFQRNKGQFADKLSQFGELYGEPITVVVLTGGIYAYGLFLNNPRVRRTAILMTTTLISGGAVQTIAKVTAGRARPLTENGHNTFKPFSRTEDYYSFVSGHTLVAMSMSFVLAKQFRSMPVKIALYSLGAIGGFSRIYNDDHWFSDVLLGAALSYACVSSADNWINQNTRKDNKKCVSTLLHVTSRQITVSLVW